MIERDQLEGLTVISDARVEVCKKDRSHALPET